MKRPRSAYVEDAPDNDTGNAVAIVNAPPPAPTPPSSKLSQSAPAPSVFDFLESGETPKATPNHKSHNNEVSQGSSNEPVMMVQRAPDVMEDRHAQGVENGDGILQLDGVYEDHGYSYGEDPVPVATKESMMQYITPGPRTKHSKSTEVIYDMEDSQTKSTDKKRKRDRTEDLDLQTNHHPTYKPDTSMADAPPTILHSGLTGGLNRLLTKSKYSPSPDYLERAPSPPTPVKRSKTSDGKKAAVEGLSRGRNGTLVKIRKRKPSDESRPRKHQRSSHHSPERTHGQQERHKQKAIEDRPRQKAIGYHADSRVEDQQVVVSKYRVDLFMSCVTKGPESGNGYSIHKALKRYHRERRVDGTEFKREEEERELFRSLRLKRNERGEVVVFF